MGTSSLDLDRLARELGDKMRTDDVSLRGAADEIGCSPATLSRLLKGKDADAIADTKSLLRAASWLGKSLGDFDAARAPRTASISDVELHLRALTGITEQDREALVAIVRAAHDVYKIRPPKG